MAWRINKQRKKHIPICFIANPLGTQFCFVVETFLDFFENWFCFVWKRLCAVGQFTPGPVLSSATFIGYQINGITGALLATVGIFFPSFIFILILNPFIAKLRQSSTASAFIDSVNIASVAVMLVVVVQMSRTTLVDWKSWVIASLSLLCIYEFKKIHIIWIIAGSAMLGYLFSLL